MAISFNEKIAIWHARRRNCRRKGIKALHKWQYGVVGGWLVCALCLLYVVLFSACGLAHSFSVCWAWGDGGGYLLGWGGGEGGITQIPEFLRLQSS